MEKFLQKGLFGGGSIVTHIKYIILLLGAPNNECGVLSQIALERANCALDLYTQNDNILFLCTGGFGKQFNTTNKPHFEYVKEYLMKHGVKSTDFLESVETSNTVDDFRMSKSIIEKEQPDVLLVVTALLIKYIFVSLC